MALQLYASHQLNTLSQQLMMQLRERPIGVWDKYVLVTQTEGINNWLQEQMAREMGIAAHIEFTKPHAVIDVLCFYLLGPQKKTISKEVMTWQLYAILQDPTFITRFPEWTEYVQDPIKRIALADKVADLLDQYEIYRPNIIQEWNKTPLDKVTDWQAWLWLRVRAATEAEYTDKTQLVFDMMAALDQPEKQVLLQRKMPLLSFVGLAVITPFYLQLFQKLGQYIDIHFYLLNPAPEQYWMEDYSEKRIARERQRNKNQGELEGGFTPGNSLLLNWGKVVKDSFYLLFQQDELINSYDVLPGEEVEEPNTSLQWVQYEINQNIPPADRSARTLEELNDGSISFHNCFTPVREVEVLYNYLVSLIDKRGEQLAPRDIVVMVTDIDKYAPFIRAVFDHAPYRFPYHIADEKITEGNNLFSALQHVLQFDTERFTAESVMELLDYPAIRNRFGLHDIDFVRRCLQDAQIRFGWEGSKEDDTYLFSWSHGLKKLLLGICMSGSPSLEWEGEHIYPTDIVEGTSIPTVIRLYQFLEVLHTQMIQRDTDRNLTDWSSYILQLTQELMDVAGEDEDEEFQQLAKILHRLEVHNDALTAPLSFAVFRHQFLRKLDGETRSHLFHRGGITFCSLIPMRSIPFKVIALLGMNFDVFPRKERRLSFSLMEQKPERGDRNVKDNDRHLFLETVLSARDYLYISFVGRDVRNGNPKPPSSLVDELADYLVQALPDEERISAEALYQIHPLYGFSQQYFKPNGLLSYLTDQAFVEQQPISYTDTPSEPPALKEVSVLEWIKFFNHPFRWHVRKTLGLYYEEDSLTLPESELFETDRLVDYQIRKALLCYSDEEQRQFLERNQQEGMLPLRNMGKVTLRKFREETGKIRSLWMEYTEGFEEQAIDLSLVADNILINGSVGSIYNNKLIQVSFSKSFRPNLVDAVQQFMLLRAGGHSIDLVFITFYEGNAHILDAQRIAVDEAQKWISNGLKQMQEGLKTPYPVWPKFPSNDKLSVVAAADYERFVDLFHHDKSAEYDDYVQLHIRNGWPTPEQHQQWQREAIPFFTWLNTYFPKLVESPNDPS